MKQTNKHMNTTIIKANIIRRIALKGLSYSEANRQLFTSTKATNLKQLWKQRQKI